MLNSRRVADEFHANHASPAWQKEQRQRVQDRAENHAGRDEPRLEGWTQDTETSKPPPRASPAGSCNPLGKRGTIEFAHRIRAEQLADLLVVLQHRFVGIVPAGMVAAVEPFGEILFPFVG